MFDPVRDRLVIFGGTGVPNPSPRSDTWALNLGAGNQWSQLSITGGPPPARYFAASAYDPAGDRFLVCGGESQPGQPLSDTWALMFSATLDADPGPAVHSGLRLSRHGSNPITGDVAVEYALPTAGPASLELLDVGGRLVRRARADGEGAGTRTLTLARRAELDPGVYFVRLRHAGAERSLRLVVLR